MTNVKHYCITDNEYDSFEKEKASISRRGLFGIAWIRYIDYVLVTYVIIALHVKVRNDFMECYV